MKINFSLDSMNIKQRIISFMSPAVKAIFSFRLLFLMKKYAKGQCLSQTSFVCFTWSYQRNLLTSMQTAQYLGYCLAFDNILIIIFQEYSTFLGPDAIFIIHNLVWSPFLDVFFGIYVSIKHLVLSRRHCPGL